MFFCIGFNASKSEKYQSEQENYEYLNTQTLIPPYILIFTSTGFLWRFSLSVTVFPLERDLDLEEREAEEFELFDLDLDERGDIEAFFNIDLVGFGS